MDPKKLQQINEALEAIAKKQKYCQASKYFPLKGPYSRDKYPKQMEFIQRSNNHQIMGLLGANGSGKTVFGSLFTYFHNSGKYPDYWTGYRFNQGPINSWVIGLSSKQLSAIQEVVFGSYLDPGTGVIPREDLLDDNGNLQIFSMPGANQIVGLCYIRHYNVLGKFDGYSKIEFKVCEQGWEQLQGTTRQWIWIDEEPEDPRVYAECVARLRGPKGKEGRMMCTFTPTRGWSDVFLSFVPNGKVPENGINPENPQKYTMVIDDNQAHISEEQKQMMLDEWKLSDPQNIIARKTGMAAMGSGKVFPVEESFYVVKRMDIPAYWPRAFGLDFASSVGTTAAVWMAQDPRTKIKYIYAEYKRKGVPADSMHVLAIQAKGKWIPGVCDPHSGHRDGGELRSDYYKLLGLELTNGRSNPQAGIAMMLNDLQMGQLKIMEDCTGIISEMRTYRWDSKNPTKVADKQDDHEIDAARYCYSKFEFVAKSLIEADEWDDGYSRYNSRQDTRDDLTGY